MFQLLFKRSYFNSILAVTAILLLAIWISRALLPQVFGDEEDLPTVFPASQNIILSNDAELALFIPHNQNPQLWDLTTKKPLFEIIQNKEIIKRPEFAAFSVNKHYLATIYGDTFGIWDLVNRRQDYYYSLKEQIHYFCINNLGNIAIIGLQNNLIQAIDLLNHQLIDSYKATSMITSMTCDQNSDKVLVGTDGNNAILWQPTQKKVLHEWTFPQSISFGLISPLGDYVLLAAGPYDSYLWKTDTYEQILSLHRRNKFFKFAYKELLMLTGAEITSDGKFMTIVTPAGMVQLWDLQKRKMKDQWSYTRSRGWPPKANFGVAVGYNPQMERVVTISNNGRVDFWKE